MSPILKPINLNQQVHRPYVNPNKPTIQQQSQAPAAVPQKIVKLKASPLSQHYGRPLPHSNSQSMLCQTKPNMTAASSFVVDAHDHSLAAMSADQFG